PPDWRSDVCSSDWRAIWRNCSPSMPAAGGPAATAGIRRRFPRARASRPRFRPPPAPPPRAPRQAHGWRSSVARRASWTVREGGVHDLAGYRTAPGVEVVLYDFGAVSLSYTVPIEGPLAGLPGLAHELWGNERLVADSRRHVEALLRTLGDAALRPQIADFVEDYSIFEVEAFAVPCEAAALWTEHAQTVAQILRAEPRPLSQQETSDATALRLSFGPNDATIIDTDAALLFDPEGDDVRAVMEFANTQLLEMRFLDQQLDDTLERAYEALVRRPMRLAALGQWGPDLRRLARLQLDSAILFEQVTNALKLVGDQYLARVYSLASRRFHLGEWDASITRKLQTIDSIYAKMADRTASRRMEILEWIII